MWEAPVAVARPAEEHWVGEKMLEVLLGRTALPATVLGAGRMAVGVSAQQQPAPGRSVGAVVAGDQLGSAQHSGPALVVAWADQRFH